MAQDASNRTVRTTAASVLAHVAVRRFSAIEFLVVLVVWLASYPLVIETRHGEAIETVLATVVMLSAVVAVGGRRRTLAAAIVLVIPACVCKWIHRMRPDLMPVEVQLVFGMVFVVYVVVQLLRFILCARRVDAEVLCAGISTYLLIGVLWAFAYSLVAERVPGSFALSGGPASGREMNGSEALYFSFVTLGTVGYGDMYPTSHAARTLAVLEAITGIFYVAVLIARLVAMYSVGERSGDAGDEG